MLQALMEIFKNEPILLWVTLFICILSIGSFIFLLWDYLNRNKQSKNISVKKYEPDYDVDLTSLPVHDSNIDSEKILIKSPLEVKIINQVASIENSTEVKTVDTKPSAKKEDSNKEPARFLKNPVKSSYSVEEIKSPLIEKSTPTKSLSNNSDASKVESKVFGVTTKRPGVPVKNVIRENDLVFEDVSFIGYSPVDKFEQSGLWVYPYVSMPKKGSVVRIPRNYGVKLRGYLEDSFQKNVEAIFSICTVAGNHCLPTSANSRPYEPDISLILRENNLNLFIDLEIDEPYGAIKRTPIHCENEDRFRDAYFNDRGWIVVRFTEKQIKQQTLNCLAFIARVIKSIYPQFIIPAKLLELPDPTKENQWTALQAQKWEKEKYREKYLGIDCFKIAPSIDSEALELNEHDNKTEQLVTKTIIGVSGSSKSYKLNQQNAHIRDKRIQFISEGHIYLIDGVHARSVTELIDTCFPIFDEEYWSEFKANREGGTAQEFISKWRNEGLRSQQLGTELHECIEKHFNGVEFIPSSEFNYFLNFKNDHKNINAYRTEWRIFDEVNLIAGTIDLITKNTDGTYDLYDWKRSKKLINNISGEVVSTNNYGQGLGKLSHLPDTIYHRYCIQQNVYRNILEKYYGLKIKSMNLVVIHPSLKNYCKLSVPILSEEANYVIAKCH